MQHQQRADAVRVGDTLLGQPGKFTKRAASVLLVRRGLALHRPDALAGVVASAHCQQLVAVEPVGFGPSRASIHFNVGGINHGVIAVMVAAFSLRYDQCAGNYGINRFCCKFSYTARRSTCFLTSGHALSVNGLNAFSSGITAYTA